MKPCTRCGEDDLTRIIVITKTRFRENNKGSMHICYVKCTSCGNTSRCFQDAGLFLERTLRTVIANWNEEQHDGHNS